MLTVRGQKQLKEYRRASGEFARPLFIKFLELEYWDLLGTIASRNQTKTLADTIRFAIKKVASL